MIFWIAIAAFLAILCILCIFLSRKYPYSNLLCIGTVFTGIAIFIIAIVILCLRTDYNQFEMEYSIQSSMYEQLSVSDISKDNLFYIMDIFSCNKKLTEYQARHIYYGIASLIPDRVMELQPIGLP